MTKTIQLRKDIHNLLKSIHNNIFYRRAQHEDIYPHVVYTIKDIFNAKVLSIDIWDKDSDTKIIEEIADNIENLKDTIITNENHTIVLYYNEDRRWIDDEDKDIERINMSFEIRYYGKEQ